MGSVSIKRGLRTRYRTRTRYKMRTRNYGLSVKRGLRTLYVKTAVEKLIETDSGLA